MIPAACTPGSAAAANSVYEMGIYRVQLAGLDTTTRGGSDGYGNYDCQPGAELQRGGTYGLAVRTNPNADEAVRAWIDFNGNGQFDAGELVLASTGRNHQGLFTVPAAAVLDQPLRLRIAADYVNAPIPTPCSTPEYSQTEDYQLLVRANALPRPVARFVADDSVRCGGPIAFRDQSLNSPTAWRWSFGDGTTSVLQSPQHTYAAPGAYTVQLRVCNATGCDSLTKVGYVQVRADAPRPAPCQPATTAFCCGFGVTRVRLGNLDRTSLDGRAGFEDFSCAARATLTADRPVAMQLATGPNAHDVRVYLDVNDNGQFDLPAELLYEGLGVQSPSMQLTVATTLSGLVYHRPLRLRIWADAAGTAPFGPCSAPLRGQVEDYSVVVLPNTTAPTAAFAVNYAQYCGPTRAAFTNATVGGATSYRWDFGDGSIATTASPPTHSYSTGGVYDITLVTANAFGSDTAHHTVVVAAACAAYCPADGTGGSVSSAAYFTRVQLANLDNQDVRLPGTGYRDYTDRAAELIQGQAYSLQAESPRWSTGSNGPWVRVTAWIDYNQDGNFSSTERLGQVSALSPYLLPFQVPLGARAGATRLRVQIASLFQPSDPNNSCPPAYQNATTEDYTVLIFPAAQAPQAGFAADITVSCSGTVQLRDTSLIAPSTWQWSFGDGGTSTQQHPQHTYAQPGTYSVSLRVANRYGASTVTKTNYIVIANLSQGPRPASCLPSMGPDINFPVTVGTVQLGGWTYTNAVPFAPYRDETCNAPLITLAPGTGTAVTVLTQSPSTFRGFAFQMWLDANDDGVLEPTTELVYNSNRHSSTVNPWTGTLHVPATAVRNRPLRLRIWWMPNIIPYNVVEELPCYRHDEVGQVRDFTAFIGSTPTSTRVTAKSSEWSFAPNPASEQLNIINGGSSKEVQIWDMAGHLCATLYLSKASNSVDVSALPRGLYIIRLPGHLGVRRLTLL
ncbi:GEVED domain-containing protein [Hymenobacter glacialis]|uniref:GEVED domain-containing protein n=1 Tax=Hymenobacter glacialis TaxID=1908236 RepID=UPI0019D39FCA|nr:GEVED domain-containing protein [Hymenobacter glacialis]